MKRSVNFFNARTPLDRLFSTGIFDSLSDQIFVQFQNKVRSLFSTFNWQFERFYSYLTVALQQDGEFDTAASPPGGVFANIWLRAYVDVGVRGGASQELNVGINFEFSFDLDDGFLTVRPKVYQGLDLTNHVLIQPQDSFKEFLDFIRKDFPDSFKTQSVTSQSFGIPILFCANGSRSQQIGDPNVGIFPGGIAGLAGKGAATLGGSSADVSLVTATVASANNWTCDANGNVAFLLRAKRLNVYADALELVWFDGFEPSNPAFGAYCLAMQFNADPDTPIPLTTTTPRQAGILNLQNKFCTRDNGLFPVGKANFGNFGNFGGTQAPNIRTRPLVTVTRFG
jgi:hypothetical protein